MTPEVFFSSGAFQSGSLREVVALCFQHDLRRLELSSGIRHEPDLLTTVRTAREQGLILQVHNYFPPPADPFVLNLAATDPAICGRSIALCRQAIDLAAELGAPFYSVHSGFALNLTPELLGKPEAQAAAAERIAIPREAAMAQFLASVRELLAHCKHRNVRLLVENNVLSPRYLESRKGNPLLLCDPEEILWFMTEIADPALGLLFDTGHARVSGTALGFRPEDFLDRVAPHISAWHLSDNDGMTDDNRACPEDAWFFPQLRAYRGAPVILEAYRLAPETILQQWALLATVLS